MYPPLPFLCSSPRGCKRGKEGSHWPDGAVGCLNRWSFSLFSIKLLLITLL